MQPFILSRAVLYDHTPWRDVQTDTDPLPITVTNNPNGTTSATATRITEVRKETTDDQ